jgi:type IX secretion system PorP/SprF family membrane protein
MMNIKAVRMKVLSTIVFVFCISILSGQQEQLYTMFMFNKIGLNPGYAGYHDHVCATGIYRNQWMGFEGAPETQLISIQAPLSNQRIGVGLNLSRHSIGISKSVTADAIYAYKIPIGKGILSLGAQASVRHLTVDYTDPDLLAVQEITIDPGVDLVKESKVIANFGVGVYYNSDQFYIGLSSPRLMPSDIDFEDNNLFVSREVKHYYLMAGYVIPLNYKIDFVPQVLVRYTDSAPVNVDINGSIIIRQNYSLGLTFRTGGTREDTGESIDLIASAKIARGLRIGVAYDFTLSELRKYSSGSLEMMIRYCFGQPESEGRFINPRYF